MSDGLPTLRDCWQTSFTMPGAVPTDRVDRARLGLGLVGPGAAYASSAHSCLLAAGSQPFGRMVPSCQRVAVTTSVVFSSGKVTRQ